VTTRIPEFHLARVYDDGTETAPEIVPVSAAGEPDRPSRREVLGKGVAVTAALGLLAGCAHRQNVKYDVYDQVTGRWISYTLPCGSPLPAGSVCTCNCVAAPRATRTWSRCSCNKVCTCVPVYRYSSRRWKTNVRPIDGARARVARCDGRRSSRPNAHQQARLAALLIEAVKAQQRQLDALARRIAVERSRAAKP
jgi:hypothetical protein